MSKNYVYIKVTADKYELPIFVADSVKELSQMCGSSVNTILSTMSHFKYQTSTLRTCPYHKVYIGDINEL